jgi:hypothetical protein
MSNTDAQFTGTEIFFLVGAAEMLAEKKKKGVQ